MFPKVSVIRTKHLSEILSVFLLMMLLICTQTAYTQISNYGIPRSFNLPVKKQDKIPGRMLNPILKDSLIKADDEQGITNRYAILQELDISLKENSLQTEVPGKGKIWRFELYNENSLSIGLFFKVFQVPEGSELFIYTPDKQVILGAFSVQNHKPGNTFTVADLKGNHAIIEYFEPFHAEFSGELVIGSASLAYRDIFSAKDDEGRIGINCLDGINWQDTKRSVARITFRDNIAAYFCTGFLINNTKEDLTPYFMTANHCINSELAASTLVAYFNFENSVCESKDADASQTLSGSVIRSTNTFSDFTLLELSEDPRPDYHCWLSGWEATGRIPLNSAGIHHPSGTPKCISTDRDPSVLYGRKIQWGNEIVSEINTHWLVRFDKGSTESGSSGSPLFDDNQRVVGQLHGGNDISNFYGTFHAGWDHDPDSSRQLKYWLDPENTGLFSLDGRDYNSIPLAGFSVVSTTVCLNNTILLSDKSKYRPSNWSWHISPDGYEFMNGSDNFSSDPEIKFTREGTFSVKLVASNQFGSDSLVKEDYLQVVSKIYVDLTGVPENDFICGSDLVNYPVTASGALEYSFSFSRPDKVVMKTEQDKAFLSLIPEQRLYGNFDFLLTVEGSFGTCKDSDSTLLRIAMPVNDDIRNAISVYPGFNGPFSNFCASVQSKEPYPPPLDCKSVSHWCPGSISEGIRNSVWFTFLGPSSGIISIETEGIDSRIAVYDADSAMAVVSGRPLYYTIIGANDDKSSTELSSGLENLQVIPLKQYWLQLESLDADTGYVSVLLHTNSLEVFPNPGTGIFETIIAHDQAEIATIFVYSWSGKLIHSSRFGVDDFSNRYTFDLSHYPPGLYNVFVKIGRESYSKKILLIP